MKEKVKDYIREKRGLKRLEVGSEVILSPDESIGYPVRKIYDHFQDNYFAVGYGTFSVEDVELIIGLTPKLNDYLAVIPREKLPSRKEIEIQDFEITENTLNVWVNVEGETYGCIRFSLDTGEPAQESDWELLAKILGIEKDIKINN